MHLSRCTKSSTWILISIQKIITFLIKKLQIKAKYQVLSIIFYPFRLIFIFRKEVNYSICNSIALNSIIVINIPLFFLNFTPFFNIFVHLIKIKQKKYVQMSVENITYRQQHVSHLIQDNYYTYNMQSYELRFEEKNSRQNSQNNKEKNDSLQQIPLKKLESDSDVQIKLLKQKQNELLVTLSKSGQHYGQVYKEYLELIQNQSEEIEDQYDRAQSNIYFVQNQIQNFMKECQQKNGQKVLLLERIKQYNIKREELNVIFQDQCLKLERLVKYGQGKQDEIKINRQIYLKLQQQIFNLDIRNENLKKYGYEQIPLQLQASIKQKQYYKEKMSQLNDHIEHENKQIAKMVKIQVINKLKNEIRINKQKIRNIQKLKEENIVLKRSNKELHEIKYVCEWNPNDQLIHLENSIKEETSKIAELEKENGSLNKKNHQIIKKIENCKKKQSLEDDLLIDNQKSKKQEASMIKNKHKSLPNKQKQSKSKLYNEIKHDLQGKSHQSSTYNSKSQNEHTKSNKNIIWINENQYKFKIKSKKLKIIYMTVIFIILTLLACKK